MTERSPLLMGILNVTPDSFSDGGAFCDAESALRHAEKMLEDGAAIIDIGGESTRPGAQAVESDEECRRILPVLEKLKPVAKRHGAKISVDTRHAQTMRRALAAGADIINDVTALTGDEESLEVVAGSKADVVLMHMQGTPGTMQKNPVYADVVAEVRDFLQARIEVCLQAGIEKSHLIVDPGIGFGKTLEHNLKLLANIDQFCLLGVRVLVGVSRKSFIGKLDREAPAEGRLPGSIAAALHACHLGASILRVHGVAETRQALAVWGAIEAQGNIYDDWLKKS